MIVPSAPVLLVDDDLAIIHSTSMILKEGFQLRCLSALSGKQAFEVIESEAVSLVLLDLGLPDMSGEEVLVRFLKDFPQVPVIIVTALRDLDVAVRCMSLGAYDYVVKGSEP